MRLIAGIFILAMTLCSCSRFDCTVITSFDHAFPDKWTHALPGYSPFLSHNDTVYPGLPWETYVFFKGFSCDDSGRANLSFSYKILKPNGEISHDTTGITAFSGFIDKNAESILSQFIPTFSFSRQDTPGKYKIIVKAEDKVAKTKKKTEAFVILSKYPEIASSDFDDVSFNIWVHTYCVNPDPGRAIAAFYYFIESNLSNDNDIFWPVLYFFQCVFSSQPFLIDELAANFPKCSQRVQEYTVFLLRAIQYNKGNGKSPIPDSLWNKFDKVAANGFYDPFTYAFKIKSNRFIEFAFYYYGRYALIRFLIDCLGLNTPEGYDAFLKNCNKYGDECMKSLDKETALEFYSISKKILEKIYTRHPLANSYCNFAYQRDNMDITSQKALKEIISSSHK